MVKNAYQKLISSVLARRFQYRLPIRQSQEVLAWTDTQDQVYRMSGPHTRIYDDVNSIRKAAIRAAPAIGLLLEFGVFKGDSIVQFRRWLDERDDTRDIVGFDSFEGFSEIWGGMAKKWSKDTFDLKGEAPSETRGIHFVKGFVEETLPDFLGSSDGEKISFVHIDTDTYSPAKAILSECREHFGEGAVILFDQLMGYPNWRSMNSVHWLKRLTFVNTTFSDSLRAMTVKGLCAQQFRLFERRIVVMGFLFLTSEAWRRRRASVYIRNDRTTMSL